MCLGTNHQCICIMNKIETNDIVWRSQEDKVPAAKIVIECVCKYLGSNVSKWTFSNP